MIYNNTFCERFSYNGHSGFIFKWREFSGSLNIPSNLPKFKEFFGEKKRKKGIKGKKVGVFVSFTADIVNLFKA